MGWISFCKARRLTDPTYSRSDAASGSVPDFQFNLPRPARCKNVSMYLYKEYVLWAGEG